MDSSLSSYIKGGYNSTVWATYGYNSYASGRRLSNIRYPSKTVGEFDNYPDNLSNPGNTLKYTGYDWVITRTIHYGGANYGFLDSHIEWLKPYDVLWLNTSSPVNNYKYWTGNW